MICPGFVRTPLVDKQIPEQAKALGISEPDVIKTVMLKETVDGEFTTVVGLVLTQEVLPDFELGRSKKIRELFAAGLTSAGRKRDSDERSMGDGVNDLGGNKYRSPPGKTLVLGPLPPLFG